MGAPSQSGTPPQAGANPIITSVSPAQNASVPVGPVTVSFTTQSFPIRTPGQIHLHFYLDTDPVPYRFYNGIHTHFVHWKSATSFDIFGLQSTAHTVRLVLANHNNIELQNTEATDTLNFSVSQPPPGHLQLQPLVGSLNFPVGLSLAPDRRVFLTSSIPLPFVSSILNGNS